MKEKFIVPVSDTFIVVVDAATQKCVYKCLQPQKISGGRWMRVQEVSVLFPAPLSISCVTSTVRRAGMDILEVTSNYR